MNHPKRILFITHGSTGDTLPLLQLAGEVVNQGHTVLFFAGEMWSEDAARRQVPLHPIPPSGDRAENARIMRGYTQYRNNRKLLEAMYKDVNSWLPSFLPALKKELADADLLVCSYLFPFYKALAEKNGIPTAAVHFCPNTYHSAERPVNPIPAPPRCLPKWMRRAYTRFMMKQGDRAMTSTLNRHLSDPELHMKSWLIRPANHSLYLAPGELFLERGEHLSGHCAFTGFLTGGFQKNLPPTENIFPVDRPLITFGSVTRADMDRQFNEFYTYWPKQQPLLVQKGWHTPPDPPADSQIQIIGPASHEALFTRAKMIIHHGGAGTTIAALRSGKPQIIIPHFADQNYWGKTIEKWGVGRRRPSSHWGRFLAKDIDLLQKNPDYFTKAADLSLLCRDPEANLRAAQQLLAWAGV